MLPATTARELRQRIDALNVGKAIIATEPKAHLAYARFFIRSGIDVLLDKPITAPLNASTDSQAAAQVYTDWVELSELARRYPAVKVSLQCQRRHAAIYRHMMTLIEEVVVAYEVPVTHIEAYHGNGHWNMPPEFLGREDHPHKYGYGKLLHSGFHFIDLFAWASEANVVLPERYPNRIRLTQLTQQPQDLLFQLPQKQHQQFFGNDVFREFFDTHRAGDFAGFGETEACSVIQLLRDNRVVTSGTISLVDTTVSQRAWHHTPTDVHRKNGHIRHSRFTAHVGPLFTIQLHNYEAHERRYRRGEPAQPGGWDHFDLYVFRNSGVIGGEPFEHIRAQDLSNTALSGTGYVGALDEAQRSSLAEFLDGAEPSTPLSSYQRTCQLLSLLLSAGAKERRGEPPLIDTDY